MDLFGRDFGGDDDGDHLEEKDSFLQGKEILQLKDGGKCLKNEFLNNDELAKMKFLLANLKLFQPDVARTFTKVEKDAISDGQERIFWYVYRNKNNLKGLFSEYENNVVKSHSKSHLELAAACSCLLSFAQKSEFIKSIINEIFPCLFVDYEKGKKSVFEATPWQKVVETGEGVHTKIPGVMEKIFNEAPQEVRGDFIAKLFGGLSGKGTDLNFDWQGYDVQVAISSCKKPPMAFFEFVLHCFDLEDVNQGLSDHMILPKASSMMNNKNLRRLKRLSVIGRAEKKERESGVKNESKLAKIFRSSDILRSIEENRGLRARLFRALIFSEDNVDSLGDMFILLLNQVNQFDATIFDKVVKSKIPPILTLAAVIESINPNPGRSTEREDQIGSSSSSSSSSSKRIAPQRPMGGLIVPSKRRTTQRVLVSSPAAAAAPGPTRGRRQPRNGISAAAAVVAPPPSNTKTTWSFPKILLPFLDIHGGAMILPQKLDLVILDILANKVHNDTQLHKAGFLRKKSLSFDGNLSASRAMLEYFARTNEMRQGVSRSISSFVHMVMTETDNVWVSMFAELCGLKPLSSGPIYPGVLDIAFYTVMVAFELILKDITLVSPDAVGATLPGVDLDLCFSVVNSLEKRCYYISSFQMNQKLAQHARNDSTTANHEISVGLFLSCIYQAAIVSARDIDGTLTSSFRSECENVEQLSTDATSAMDALAWRTPSNQKSIDERMQHVYFSCFFNSTETNEQDKFKNAVLMLAEPLLEKSIYVSLLSVAAGGKTGPEQRLALSRRQSGT